MLEIGLTGGMGSGKSTVAQQLIARGAVLIDADAIVRELQSPGQPVLAQMVERFGEGILLTDGRLDRPGLAAVVFGDRALLDALNDIVHPAVVDEMTRRRQALANTDSTVVLDIPLLVESRYSNLGGVVVVDTDPEVAVERLVQSRGFTADDARSRIAKQASREERLAVADYIIENSGTLAELGESIALLWAWIESLPRPEPSDTPVVPIRSGRSR